MSGNFNTIDDFDVEDKTVLVRVDVNSPVDPSSGIILDDTRLKLHAQTIKELAKKGARVVIIAHQSRPGKDDFTTLSQHADALSDILNLRVKYVDSIFSTSAKKAIKDLKEAIGSETTANTILKRIKDVETSIGTETTANTILKRIKDVETAIGTESTEGTILYRIKQLEPSG